MDEEEEYIEKDDGDIFLLISEECYEDDKWRKEKGYE